jgi:hypothetical protein
VLVLILQHLREVPDLARASLVCRRWHLLIDPFPIQTDFPIPKNKLNRLSNSNSSSVDRTNADNKDSLLEEGLEPNGEEQEGKGKDIIENDHNDDTNEIAGGVAANEEEETAEVARRAGPAVLDADVRPPP